MMKPKRLFRFSVVLGLLLLICSLSILTGLTYGAATVAPWQWWDWQNSITLTQLIWVWRAPRVLLAFLVGALLAISGVIFQGVFRNPLAEPYLLGSASGAGVGAALALLLPSALTSTLPLFEYLGLPILAFLGAWGASFLVLALARHGGSWQTAPLLLAGVALAAMLSALRGVLILWFGDETSHLRALVSWQLGGLQTPTWNELAFLTGCLWFILITTYRLSAGLDALGLGDVTAKSLGVDLSRFTAIAVLVAALATALAVCWGGLIGFIGLIIPHVLRWWVGHLHRRLIPTAALAGGSLLVLVDTVARSVLAPSEIPIGLLTALIGGPFFIYLLRQRHYAHSV
jgi:iron complex transport system permease protein